MTNIRCRGEDSNIIKCNVFIYIYVSREISSKRKVWIVYESRRVSLRQIWGGKVTSGESQFDLAGLAYLRHLKLGHCSRLFDGSN